MYAGINKVPRYMKQKSAQLRENIYESMIVAGNFVHFPMIIKNIRRHM